MSKAEDYIKEHTRQCSNTFWDKNDGEYNCSWLTPDQARKAVEIAREEIYEWLRNVSFDDYKIADEESYRMGCPYDDIDVNRLINDLKKATGDE